MTRYIVRALPGLRLSASDTAHEVVRQDSTGRDWPRFWRRRFEETRIAVYLNGKRASGVAFTLNQGLRVGGDISVIEEAARARGAVQVPKPKSRRR